MTQELKRISTRYDALEDRVRISGETENSATLTIWLTHRLLQHLLPRLLEWLGRQSPDVPHADVLQGFAQQAAWAEKTPQQPVVTDSVSAEWLVHSVELSWSPRAIRLIFKGAGDENAGLNMADRVLRQWLSIVYNTYLKAGWPLDIWPQWVRESAPRSKRQEIVMH